MAVVSDVEIRLRADIARLQADMDRARQTVGGTMDRIKSAVEGARKAFIALSVATGVGALLAFVGSLKGMVAGNIEATGSLYDLSLQSGASVAALTAFRAIGATSDTTAESLAGAMNKLAKGMAVSNEESKGLPGAIAAIGLKFADLRKMNPEEQMLAIAKALDGFGSGAGKSAVAMALYGKEGAKLLPFLADLAADADKVTASLTDQQKAAMLAAAAMADNYGDTLTMIDKASKETGKAITAGMLPALYETATAVLAVVTETGGLRDTVKGLAADGSIANWTRASVTAITYLLDGFDRVIRAVHIVSTIVGGALSTMATFVTGSASAMKSFIEGDYTKSFGIMKETALASAGVVKGAFVDLGKELSRDLVGEKLRAQLKLAREAKAETADVKPQVDFKPDPEVDKELEKQIKAFHDLTAVMRTHVEETKRAAAGLEPYNEAQKESVKLTEELAAGKRKLSPVQEAEIRGYIKQWETNLQVIDTLDKSKKAAEDMAKMEKELGDARAAVVKKAEDEANANEELVATFGLTKTAIEQLELARLKEQLAQRGNVGITADEIAQLENLIALKERSAAAVGSAEAMKSVQEFWTSIDKTAHDTFGSIADGGKGMWQRLKESGKNIFFEWLYQMTVKKWIVNIGASLDGGTAVSGITSATGALSAASSTLSSIYTAATGGGLGTGFLGSLTGGLNGAGAGSGLTSSLGLSIGNTIADTLGPTISSALSTGISGLATALPWVGAAVGIYSLAKAAFGRGPKEYADNSTLAGSLSGSGFAGTVNTAYTQKGGWFRSDKSGTDKAAVDAALATSLGATYAAITSASADYAKALGLSADSIATRTQALSVTLGKDEAANQKVIEEFFVGVGDNIARELLPNIAAFAAEGESASTTLQRLVVDMQTVDVLLAMLGSSSTKAFGDTGAAAIDAREKLIGLAGGLQNLATQMQYIADNFVTQDAKMAVARKQVEDTMAAIAGSLSLFGYGSIKSIADYTYVVQDLTSSNALATDAGRQLYATLLALAPAFKSVSDYAEEVKSAANDRAGAALDALGKAVEAQKNVVAAAYEKTMAVLEKRIDSLGESISTMTSLSNALKGSLSGVDAPGAAEGSRGAAAAQIAAALAIAKASGVLPSQDSLTDALATLKATSSDQFASLADYQRSVAQSNAAIEALGGLTDTQISAAEQQLSVLTGQRDDLTAANTAQLARLDALVVAAQSQINAVNGINDSVLTIGQALLLVSRAAGALGVLTGISATTVTTPQTSAFDAIFGPAAILEEMRTLNERIARMEAHAAETAASSAQFATQFNSVSAGGNALLTETA